jgi:hypothetical protein
MTFITALATFKETGIFEFKSEKKTNIAIVKAAVPSALDEVKNNFSKFSKFIDLLNLYVNDTILNINSKAMLHSFVRKLVKEKYGDVSKQYGYMRVFSMTVNEKNERSDMSSAIVNSRNESQITITTDQITQFKNSLITETFNLPNSIILAQLCSGCRLIEILSDKFQFIRSEKKNNIIQSDVAKNKTESPRPVDKPVLFVKPREFIKLVRLIRLKMTTKENDTNVILNNRYSKKVNAIVKANANEFGLTGITTSHDLRRIYANLSFKNLAPANMSLQVWVSRVLGHDNTNSAINYTTLNLI